MIKRMLTTDVINSLKEAKELKKKIKTLQRKSKQAPELETLEEDLKKHKPMYLEEDCLLLRGGGFNKGKELSLEETKRLLDFGFHLIWVTDEPVTENDKKKDVVYTYKNELYKIVSKAMVVLEEANAKRPGSTIKIMEGDDLLKQTIEALQLDGAKYLAHSIFGEGARNIDSLKAMVRGLYQKIPEQVDLFDNTSIGNLYKLGKKKKKKEGAAKSSDKKEGQIEEERSNFFQRFMINMVLIFVSTANKIQKIRLQRDPNDRPDINRRPDPIRRHGYIEEQLEEGAMAALFAEYGHLHEVIDRLIIRNTRAYYDDEGKLEGSGFTKLDPKSKLTLAKHCNVSYNFFASLKEKGFVNEVARGILQYHHRGLNDSGYPKRKTIDERIQHKDEFGNISVASQNVYDAPIEELTRLAGICSFFVEYLFQTPFHIPFQRDNLIRHLIVNSIYPPDQNNQPDKNGVLDIQSQYVQGKRFDGYLVDEFLKSINIYKIGEEIPIYNFNDTSNKKYDAVVVSYNEQPHRPVVKILGEEKELDLSLAENESLYIGEYIPSLRFEDVIEKYHLDRIEGGILLDDQMDEEDQDIRMMKKQDRETAAMLNDIFEDNPQISEAPQPTAGAPEVDIDSLISANLPPELVKAQQEAKTAEKKVEETAKLQPKPDVEEKEKEKVPAEPPASPEPEDTLPDIDLEDFHIGDDKEIVEVESSDEEKEVPIVGEDELLSGDMNLFDNLEAAEEEISFEPPVESAAAEIKTEEGILDEDFNITEESTEDSQAAEVKDIAEDDFDLSGLEDESIDALLAEEEAKGQEEGLEEAAKVDVLEAEAKSDDAFDPLADIDMAAIGDENLDALLEETPEPAQEAAISDEGLDSLLEDEESPQPSQDAAISDEGLDALLEDIPEPFQEEAISDAGVDALLEDEESPQPSQDAALSDDNLDALLDDIPEPFMEEEAAKVEDEKIPELSPEFDAFDEDIAIDQDIEATEQIDSLASKLFSIYCKRGNEVVPYGLGQLISSKTDEKEFMIKYVSQLSEEGASYYTYKYSLVNEDNQHRIKVLDPQKHAELAPEVLKFYVTGEYDQDNFQESITKPVSIGDYHLLYYVAELDPKNSSAVEAGANIKGVPKYIVRVKEKSDELSKPIVTFIRYIRSKDNEVDYVRDSNCAKDFDLKTLPFFRIDRVLTAKEVIKYLKLVVL